MLESFLVNLQVGILVSIYCRVWRVILSVQVAALYAKSSLKKIITKIPIREIPTIPLPSFLHGYTDPCILDPHDLHMLSKKIMHGYTDPGALRSTYPCIM